VTSTLPASVASRGSESAAALLQRQDPWDWLATAQDDDIPLLAAVLLIAKDEYPTLDVDAYMQRFIDWQSQLAARLGPDFDVIEALKQLNYFLFEELGFSGNVMDFYDPRNSFLNDVIERKLGIPISLAVLYVEFGRSVGVKAQGVSFPGHFLVRVPVKDGVIVIDPFHRGKSIGSHELQLRARRAGAGDDVDERSLFELLAPASHRAILIRMLHNLKGAYLERKDTVRALRVCHRLVQLNSDEPSERRDRGLLYLEMGAGNAASADLRAYLEHAADASDVDQVQDALVRAQLLPRGA
jgi:regulator of sirC expression with transglutaminase-like and TPR domain